jgi:3-methyladenine DNA glycosylase AlkC
MSQVFLKTQLCKVMLVVRYWILDKEIPNYSIMLLTPLDLAAEMILDTGFWILDKNLHKSRISHLVSSIEHPASSIQYPATSNQSPVTSIQRPATRDQNSVAIHFLI